MKFSSLSFKSSLNRGSRSDVALKLAFEAAGKRYKRTSKAKVKGSIGGQLASTLLGR